MRHINLPVLFGNVEASKAPAFVFLFTCDSLARSILISLVPLQVYALMGSAQIVSTIYFLVAIIGLIVALTLPMLLQRAPRLWVFAGGALTQAAGVVLLAMGTPASLCAGLAVQMVGMASLEVALNLYLLDHVPRRDLNHFEPLRLVFSGTAFAAGPWLGIYLFGQFGAYFPYIVSILATVLMLSLFWRMRLTQNGQKQEAFVPARSPLSAAPRFIRQPRLVLSWLLAYGRSSFWVVYFIYTPIYVSNAGYSAAISGGLVSLGLAAMLLVRVWGRIGKRFGLRNLLTLAYGLTGFFCLAAGLSASHPPLVMAFIVLAAWSATMIDGAGNVPFLRAVRPHDRDAMTPIFMTFRYSSSLIVPGVLALVLWVAPLQSTFVFAGLSCIVMVWLSRKLPRSM